MSVFRALAVRLRSLVRGADVEQELDEEMRYHIDHETERLIASGWSPADAKAEVRRAFGNVSYLKEQSRDARGVRVLEIFGRDLAYSFRLARRQPIFGAVVVLSLSLGLGAATAVFSLTYNVLFAKLAVPQPDNLALLVRVTGTSRDEAFSRDEYHAIRALPNLGRFAAMRTASQIAVELERTREYVNAHFVDGAFFPMLALSPLQGRLISPADDDRQATVAVLSAPFADRLAPGDSALVGKTVIVRGVPFTIVGITPRAFRGVEFPGQFTLAIPLSTMPLLDRAGRRSDDRGQPLDLSSAAASRVRALRIVGRVDTNRSTAGAAIAQVIERCCDVDGGAGDRVEISDMRRGIVGGKDDARREIGAVLLILLGAMVLLVVVVCCNIASLLVVRASARAREIAVRLSLGASRRRLISQLVLETFPLAVLGGLGGMLFAEWATNVILRSMADWDSYADIVGFHPTPAVLLFGVVATVVCALGFATYPAVQATRGSLSQALRVDTRMSRSRKQGMVARGVVVAQVALAVVLVTAASLMAVTLRNLRRVDGGFAVDGVLMASLETRGTTYEARGTSPLNDEVLAAVRAAPGVRSAVTATMLPMFGGTIGWLAIDVPGYTPARGEDPLARQVEVSPDYFRALGIPLQAGREFTIEDSPGGARTAIVSAAFARRYFRNADPVGRSLRVRFAGDSMTTLRVVGVASDAKYMSPRDRPEAVVYLPFAQTVENWWALQVAIRTDGDPMAVAPAVLRAIDAAAPGIRVRRVSDMRARLDIAVSLYQLSAQLASFAGAMVLALCAVGLYGVVAYGVARRTSELGLRMALGARATAIVRLIVGEMARVMAVGLAIGLVLSMATNKLLASQLFGVSAHDPLVMLFAMVTFSLVALIACAVPARRAVRIDPAIALAAD